MTRTSRDGSLTAKAEADAQEQMRLVDSPEPGMENNDIQEYDKDAPIQLPIQRININRPVMTQTMLSGDLPRFQSSRMNPWEYLKTRRCSPLGCLLSLMPILYWLPRYEWRRDITYDLTAGFTVAVLHIPQGMAYALLGNLPPIIGIYMAFFPVIIYSIMGTSRHVSMGTFAVICLMTGKVAAERVAQYNMEVPSNSTVDVNNTFVEAEATQLYSTTDIATALSLCVGLWQVLMGVFRLGALSLLLSAEVVSGFTTGAAVHVLTSQFKNLFGLQMGGRSGLFKILLTYRDIATNITNANVPAVIMSAITILSLIIYNEILKPYVSAKISFPLPVELLTIIVGTLVSANWEMKSTFNVTIVEYIPTGFPPPAIPPINILPDLMVDSLTISIVAYAISISMSKIFAIKYNYKLDPNQELIAQGTSNIFGSMFSCAPIAASLSRSLVQELVGGRTQLAGLFSCGIMVFVLLWIGPFFETLPNCVLSAIIVVALKGMFLQVFDLPKAWKVSILNAMIWIITFLATVILDIEYGLAAGILLSILILIWRSNKPHIEVLGVFSDLDLYVACSHAQSKEIPGRKIIKYTGNLNFATIEHFVKKVERLVPSHRNGISCITSEGSQSTSASILQAKQDTKSKCLELQLNLEENINWVILDFSGLSSIDPEALKSLGLLCKRYEKAGIQCLFAACSPTVLEVMTSCKFVNQIGGYHFFPTIHDAVTHASPGQNQPVEETVP